MNRYVVSLAALLLSVATQAHAGDDCKAVAAKDIKQVTKAEFEHCRGPIIAAAMCNGWRQGKTEQGCKDRQTSALWSKSNDPTTRSKGEACLAGESLDHQCGLH